MKSLLISLSLLAAANSFSQTIWNGPITTFQKIGFADHTLEVNQDRISDSVWITRASNKGIFNIKKESGYTASSSPIDTEWAFGTTSNIGALTFTNWEDTHASSPPSTVNQDMVLHLISEDIYIDIKFTAWLGSGGGAGFTYERSTPLTLETEKPILPTRLINIYPNPAKDKISLDLPSNNASIKIYDQKGKLTKQVQVTSKKQSIDVSELDRGIYYVEINSSDKINILKIILE